MKTRTKSNRFAWRFMASAIVFRLLPWCSAADWPQYQCTPQRTGYSPENIGQPFFRAWGICFLPEQVMPLVQPIIYRGLVIVGTKSGNLYAFKTQTGETAWQFAAAWPIIHTAAAGGGKVFFASIDGTIYALEAGEGVLAWKYKADGAVCTTPLLAEDKLFIGTRNGIMCALRQADGAVVWTVDMGAPIYNSAAYDNSRIFFGCEDMRLYCLNAADGAVVWKSEQLKYMQSFKAYCPVVHKGRVIVRPLQVLSPSVNALNNGLGWVPQPFQWPAPPGYFEKHLAELQSGEMPPDMLAAQDEIIKKMEAEPDAIEFFVFDAATGRRGPTAPIYRAFSMAGPVPPPAVDRDGMLIVGVLFEGAKFGRYDIEKNRLVDLFIPNDSPAVLRSALGNVDETYAASCAGDLVWIMHSSHGSHGSGIYQLDTRFYHSLELASAGHSSVPRNSVRMLHPEQGVESRDTVGAGMAMNDVVAASIGDGMFFHIAFGRLLAYRGCQPGAGFVAVSEIRDWRKAAETIRADNSPVFEKIRTLLERSALEWLMNQYSQGVPEDGPKVQIKYSLLKALNEMLKRRDFYDAKSFSGAALRPQVRAAVEKGFDGLDEAGVVKLNRAILEDVMEGVLLPAAPE